MASSSTINIVQVAISVQMPEVAKEITKEFDKVDAPGIGARLSKGLTDGMLQGFADAGKAVLDTVSGAFSSGFDQLKAVDVAQAKMRGLGTESLAVAKATDSAFAAVQGTAFGAGDAAGVAGQLMAANIAPGQQLESVLKTVGSSATAAGTDFGTMGSIFAEAASQMGGVQNDVLSDLEGRGIPVYKALADQLGVTTDEVFKMASDGQISFEAFEQAASTAAGAISNEMGGTATGSFDIMMGSLERLAMTIMEDVFPLIAPVFKEIAKWLDEAAVNVKPLAEAFATGLKGAFEAVSTAVQNLSKWLQDNYAWISSLAAGVVGAGLAFGAWTLATNAASIGAKAAALAVKGWSFAVKAWSFATKAAAGVQWLFNAALNANPIMLIVMAIAALVAGLVWFFTQTEVGKQAWEQFTGFLSEAWENVSAFFQQVWENVLKPIFDGIAEVATWVFETILLPAFLAIQTAFEALAGFFQEVWEGFLKPVFDAIGAIFLWLWDTIIKVVIWYITTYIQVLSTIFTWLWEAIIQPVFTAIGAIFNWIWTNVIQPIVLGIQLVIKALGAIFTWLWQEILLPAFTGIGELFNWIWTKVIQPTVSAIKTAIDALGTVFNWLYDTVVKPVWDAISSAISTVWEKGIKPVIDTISKVIQTDPKKAFEAARDAIGKAWEGIQDLAKAPVKFVIETVINGLIGKVNGILPEGLKIPKVPLPKGFSDGGYTGNIGTAAVAGVVHGNEHVIRAQSRRRIEASHPGLLDHMNQYGSIPGYRKGGLVNPLPQGSYSVSQNYGNQGHNGIDLAAAAGTRVYAAADGVVGLAGVVPMGGNEVYVQHANGLGTRYSHLSRFATQAGSKVSAGHVIGYVGSTGMSTGPHLHYMVHAPGGGGGSYANHVNPAPYMGVAGKDLGEAGSAWNILDGLVDWAVDQIKRVFPGGGMFIDMAASLAKGAAKSMADAFNPFASADGHTATLYDSGGWLPTGLSLVENRTGSPEPILTGSQWDTLASSGTGGVEELNVTVTGTDRPEETARAAVRALRQHRFEKRARGGVPV